MRANVVCHETEINHNLSCVGSSAGNERFGKLSRGELSGPGEDSSNVAGQAANQERRGKAV